MAMFRVTPTMAINTNALAYIQFFPDGDPASLNGRSKRPELVMKLASGGETIRMFDDDAIQGWKNYLGTENVARNVHSRNPMLGIMEGERGMARRNKAFIEDMLRDIAAENSE
jgi:hypothetical protein